MPYAWKEKGFEHFTQNLELFLYMLLKFWDYLNENFSSYKITKWYKFFLKKEAGSLARGESVGQWTGRPGFNPRSRHTKDFKNGTWYLLA